MSASRAMVSVLVAGDSLLEALDHAQDRAAAARFSAWLRLADGAYAENTKRAIAKDLRTYVSWCRAQLRRVLPADAEHVVTYLRHLSILGKKRATIERALYTLTLVHKACGYPNPVDAPEWELTWKGFLNELVAHDGHLQSQAHGLTADEVAQILGHLADSPHDIRDCALIMIASDTLCRRSELAAMRLEHLRYESRTQSWSIVVTKSKTNPHGDKDDARFVSAETKAALDRWVAIAGIQRGPLFLAIGGRPRSKAVLAQERRLAATVDSALAGPLRLGVALTSVHIGKIFKQRAKAAGIVDAKRVSGHSLRVGTAQDLRAAGADIGAIMQAGGWTTARMVNRYTQHIDIGRGAVAQLRRSAPLHAASTAPTAPADDTPPGPQQSNGQSESARK